MLAPNAPIFHPLDEQELAKHGRIVTLDSQIAVFPDVTLEWKPLPVMGDEPEIPPWRLHWGILARERPCWLPSPEEADTHPTPFVHFPVLTLVPRQLASPETFCFLGFDVPTTSHLWSLYLTLHTTQESGVSPDQIRSDMDLVISAWLSDSATSARSTHPQLNYRHAAIAWGLREDVADALAWGPRWPETAKKPPRHWVEKMIEMLWDDLLLVSRKSRERVLRNPESGLSRKGMEQDTAEWAEWTRWRGDSPAPSPSDEPWLTEPTKCTSPPAECHECLKRR